MPYLQKTLRSGFAQRSALAPSRCWAAFVEVLLATSLCACSLTNTTADPCESTAECRAAYGLGSACGRDGFCFEADRHLRCPETFPANLLDDPSRFADAFLVGYLANGASVTHNARQQAVRLAFREAADQGGIDGREVGVVFCTNEVDLADGLGRSEASAEIVRYFHESLAITAMVGPMASSATIAAFESASMNGQLIVSPSATSPALTDLEPSATDEMPGLLWRTAPPDSLQARVIAEDLATRGVTNVAIIYADDAYGNGLADFFDGEFVGTATRFSFSTVAGRNNASATAGAGDFQEVLFISSETTDVSGFLLFANTFPGYADKAIFLTDTGRNGDIFTDAVAAAALFPRVRGTAPAPGEGIAWDAFLASYRAEYAEMAAMRYSYTAQAYDAAWLTLLGALWSELQEGASFEGRSLARGLRRLSSGAPIRLQGDVLGNAFDHFQAGESIDIEGASGQLDYDQPLEETRAPIEVWTIMDLDYVSQYTVTP